MAVAALGVSVAVDAILDDSDESSASEPPLELVQALTAAGVGGTLLYTDAGCRLRALRLPELERVRPPPRRRGGCRFSASPDGASADSPDAAWSRDGETVARCLGGVLRVEAVAEQALAGQHRGCPAAWRPNGELTYAVGGAIYAPRSRCAGAPPCERVVVPGRALRAAAAQHPNLRDAARPIRVAVQDFEWLTNTRLAVRLVAYVRRTSMPEHLVAILERSRLVGVHTFLRDISARIEVSPNGSLVALEPAELLRADGEVVELPTAFDLARAFAWAPDGRFLAAATRASIFVVKAAELELAARTRASAPIHRLPITARDVAWVASRG